ncbi:protein BNIP5 [Ochotona curzoniae]|uniref:protein BNIP5 n=1 Tax=Ochotona curzoniae TaxID=130825 RepID=UPI001B34F5C9|nr:protein BNIP5 [Ochotona curzoniae]
MALPEDVIYTTTFAPGRSCSNTHTVCLLLPTSSATHHTARCPEAPAQERLPESQPTEKQRQPQTPPVDRRVPSPERLQDLRRDSESCHCQCLSVTSVPRRSALRQTASIGTSRPVGTTVLPPEEMGDGLYSEQRPPRDTKKDKAPRWAQQQWLKMLLNFLLRMGPEEPKEKTSRLPKEKEGHPQASEPPRAAGEPAIRRKTPDRKSSPERHNAEKPTMTQNAEAGGPEAGRTGLGPAHGGGDNSHLHQSLLTKREGAGVVEATGPQQEEEELAKLDQDTAIQMIVELLKRVGDQWEEERLQVPQAQAALQTLAATPRKQAHERKSSLKRAFSLRKSGSGAPRGARPAHSPSAEARPPRRPGFLPLCMGGHRPSIPSSPGLEEPETQEAGFADGGGPGHSTIPLPAGHQGPGEELQLDRALESKEFIRKITALLHNAEQQGAEQHQVCKAQVPAENPVPPCRKKSHERKSSFKQVFAQKRHCSKEPKRGGPTVTANPDPRPPKRPGFLPLCVGGQRPSFSDSLDPEGSESQGLSPTEGLQLASQKQPPQAQSHTVEEGQISDAECGSKDLIIQELVALLQVLDGQLGKQIRRHPSFKMFFYEFPDSSLQKLVTTLRSQEVRSLDPCRNPTGRPYPFALGLPDRFAGDHSHASCRLMGSVGHYRRRSYSHFPNSEAQLNVTSLQSPD